MAHVPRAICGDCNIEMRPQKNGVDIEMITEDGSPYYKISSDRYACPNCLRTIYVGMGEPFAFHFQDNYDNIKVDEVARFAV